MVCLTLAVCSTIRNPELVGNFTKEEIYNKLPLWEELSALYTPNPDSIDRLKTIDFPLKIDIYLGTWCRDSEAHVSEYFRIIEMVDNPFISTDLTGIPSNNAARGPFIQGKDIQRVPTFIVYIDGKEIGRIIESPKKSLEDDLVEIIYR